MKIIPWAEIEEILPPLGEPERIALAQSIASDGVKQPILVLPDGRIIDGHHRWRIADGKTPHIIVDISEDHAFDLAIELNLARRQLSRKQLSRIREKQNERREARKQKALDLRQQGATQEEAAEAVGVARETVRDWENTTNGEADESANSCAPIPDNRISVPKDHHAIVFDRYQDGVTQAQIAADYQVTQQAISKIIKAEEKHREKEEKRKQLAERGKSLDLPGGVDVWVGDFRIKAKDIPDNSIDMIFTDPPYDRKSMPLYGEMTKIAKRVLKPGGSLLTYCGHYIVPDILEQMKDHLTFWWIIAIEHTGSHSIMFQKGITVGWKPILWFVKGERRFEKTVTDHFKSSPPDKIVHDWEQDTSEAIYYIEHLTREGDNILDPFCGSGTTLIAALTVNRKAIGIEIDANKANIAKSRIEDFTNSQTS